MCVCVCVCVCVWVTPEVNWLVSLENHTTWRRHNTIFSFTHSLSLSLYIYIYIYIYIHILIILKYLQYTHAFFLMSPSLRFSSSVFLIFSLPPLHSFLRQTIPSLRYHKETIWTNQINTGPFQELPMKWKVKMALVCLKCRSFVRPGAKTSRQQIFEKFYLTRTRSYKSSNIRWYIYIYISISSFICVYLREREREREYARLRVCVSVCELLYPSR